MSTECLFEMTNTLAEAVSTTVTAAEDIINIYMIKAANYF